MHRTPPTLPIEVCERVLDHLDLYEHTKTVYSCCLVCRAWVPRSRLHLYTSVELDPYNLTKFIRGISLQPLNGHLVRELILKDAARARDRHKLSLVPLQLPQLLSNLRHIELYDIRLADLHPNFFTYLSRFRSVHSVDLSYDSSFATFMQLARWLTAFSHLDECNICLKKGDIESLSFPGARLPTRKIAVSKLTLWMPRDPQLAGPILDIFSPSSIRSLTIGLESPSDQEEAGQLVASFVTKCASALSELTLKRYVWEHLDLSQNTSLVSLDLSMFGFKGSSDAAANSSHRSTISRALSTICSTHLKTLRLGILIATNSEGTIPPSGWDTLDATLALPTFCEVERISIEAAVVPSGNYWPKSEFSCVSERTVRQLLPRLAARSVADFSPPMYLWKPVRGFEISSPDKQDALELETVDSQTPQLDDQDVLQLGTDDSEMSLVEDQDDLELLATSKIFSAEDQEIQDPDNHKIGPSSSRTDDQDNLQLEIRDCSEIPSSGNEDAGMDICHCSIFRQAESRPEAPPSSMSTVDLTRGDGKRRRETQMDADDWTDRDAKRCKKTHSSPSPDSAAPAS